MARDTSGVYGPNYDTVGNYLGPPPKTSTNTNGQPTFDQVFSVLYPGWGRPAAQADFNAGGWKNKAGAEQFLGGGQTQQTQSPIAADPQTRTDQSILDSFQRLQTEANKRITETMAKNPFRLDEVLTEKRGEAAEQIDPYYDETLTDFLTGVEKKRTRSTQDTQDLLGELSATTESFTGTTKLRLDEALNKSAEGFAEAGLFGSGKQLREEGLLQREAGDVTSEFGRRQALRTKQAETGLSRTLEDLGLEQKQKVRDIERERTTGIETLASDLTKEAGQEYATGIYASLPPEYQANQGFDILKQIGIYG